MNLEINLYLIDEVDFKDLKLKRKLKEIVKGLYNDELHKNDNFKFYLTKNGTVKQIKVNELRQSIKLDINKKEYNLKIVIDGTILFNDVVKVK
jgi:hypothetical protein